MSLLIHGDRTKAEKKEKEAKNSRILQKVLATRKDSLQKIDDLAGQRQDGAGQGDCESAGDGPGGLGAADGGLALGDVGQPVDEVVGLEEENGRQQQDGLGLVADDPAEQDRELVPVELLAGRGHRGQHVRFARLGPLGRRRFGKAPCVVVVLETSDGASLAKEIGFGGRRGKHGTPPF